MNHLAGLAAQTDAGRGFGARRAGEITPRFPDTELALLAAQRIAHLGGTEKILLEAHDRQPLAVPEGVKKISACWKLPGIWLPPEIDPAQLAADYVKHLEQHPLDTEVRETPGDHLRRPLPAAGPGRGRIGTID